MAGLGLIGVVARSWVGGEAHSGGMWGCDALAIGG